MTLDRIQSKQGMLQITPENGYLTTGTGSTVASNQFIGGVALHSHFQLLPGLGSTGGGGQVVGIFPAGATSTVQAFATTGMITHGNAPVVALSVSTTGIALNLQAAVSAGQMLTIVNIPGTTASIVSTLNTTGVGGTTTVACAVLDQAYTIASTASPVFIAMAQLGGTATTNVPYVWRRIV